MPESDRSTVNQLHRAVIHDIYFDPISKSTLIASDQGLYIVDSRLRVTLITETNSRISDNKILSISRGKGDVFWIGTYAGLNYLVPTVFENTQT